MLAAKAKSCGTGAGAAAGKRSGAASSNSCGVAPQASANETRAGIGASVSVSGALRGVSAQSDLPLLGVDDLGGRWASSPTGGESDLDRLLLR